MNGTDQGAIFARFAQWAEGQPLVRAMILTSSRTVPGGPVDALTDYDLILVLADIRPYFADRAWLGDFGPVLAVYQDPIQDRDGFETSAYVTQYEDGLKVDFSLWPVGYLQHLAAAPQLLDEFDAGYLVLLDHDGLTDGLQPPTYRAYIPTPPSERAYQETIESFFLDTGYVAKFLWRDDLVAAKYILDYVMKQEYLRPMLEWQIEINHGWSVKPGPYGRRLKRYLPPDLWAALEATCVGPDLEDNWAALERTIALFHQVAGEVGVQLGYAYPDDLERRTVAYLQRVRGLER